MADDYTPTWLEVRDAYAQGDAEGEAEFARWEVALRAEWEAEQGEPRITIEHEGGNTITGTPEQVLNHGHPEHWWACAVNAPRPDWVGPCDCDLSRAVPDTTDKEEEYQ